MNSRIKELAEQSGIKNPFVQETVDHFASLLLNECNNLILNSTLSIDPDIWVNSSKKEISNLVRENLVKTLKQNYGF
jgi:hypothetical protein